MSSLQPFITVIQTAVEDYFSTQLGTFFVSKNIDFFR
jgi:hypothetical protein